MALKNFPPKHFYHLAHTSNLPSIRQHGLMSTESLLAVARIPRSEHKEILNQHRQEQLVLSNGIIIRDQCPMPPHALAKALPEGVTPSDWYRLLNTFVFLWPNKDRVERHWRACNGVPQSLLIFDALRLLEELGDRIYVSPINSGNARRRPSRRSPGSFVLYQEWVKTGWPPVMGKQRSHRCLPAEVLVKGKLPLEPYLIAIE
jgi:hypothetical protein